MTSLLDNSPTPEQVEFWRKNRMNSMAPREDVTPSQRESVRLLDAQQSLASPLYRKKAEELGMEEYLRRHVTTRVR